MMSLLVGLFKVQEQLVAFHSFKTIFFLLLFYISPSIAHAEQAENTGKELIHSPKIVVSIAPLYEIISSLSHGIVKPQVIYLNLRELKQPLNKHQLNILHEADIFIWVGEGYEPLLYDYFEENKQQTKDKIITLSNYIPLLEKEHINSAQRQTLLFTDRQASSDLRFWMDSRLVKMLLSVITPQLVFMDPEHQEEYLDNEIIVKAQLKKVEDKIVSFFQQLSFEQKQMMAQFNPYLKNRYLSFENIKQMDKDNIIKPEMTECIKKYSFVTIPLYLDYTEKALIQLQKIVEQCYRTMLIRT